MRIITKSSHTAQQEQEQQQEQEHGIIQPKRTQSKCRLG
jgi:hypothetical protein